MSARVACLHTAKSNIAIFEAANRSLAATGAELRHAVRADLLADAERDGGLAPEVAERTETALTGLYEGADALLLTCSTLGPVADSVAPHAPVPVIRVDAALARDAVKEGGRVVVLYALDTTRGPTRCLFLAAAQATGARITMQRVAQAWDAFKAGDTATYLRLIADSAEEARREGTTVALAQASMAGAASLVRGGRPPLTSPSSGLAAALAAIRTRSDGQPKGDPT